MNISSFHLPAYCKRPHHIAHCVPLRQFASHHSGRQLCWFGILLSLLFTGCDNPVPDRTNTKARRQESAKVGATTPSIVYLPRTYFDTSGFTLVAKSIQKWSPQISLNELSQIWDRPAVPAANVMAEVLKRRNLPLEDRIQAGFSRVMYLNFEGETEEAYRQLTELRKLIESDDQLAKRWLYTLIYNQGVTSLRQGENSNCINCRGETSCILPVSRQAIHQFPEGSRNAIQHFREYLSRFPDDLQVKWLFNVAYMTLGEHPHEVDPQFLISIDEWSQSEDDIGRFRDIGAEIGMDHLNQAGGGIMEDFDNDGLLDIVVTSMDPTERMRLYRNSGDGRFAMSSESAGMGGQLGGLYCVQTDFNNDGFLDVFIARGAWLLRPIRPTLLRTEGDGTWTDVTADARLIEAVNSNSVSWGDYDQDGNADLFVCCETQPNRLYHSHGDGTFEDVAANAGLSGGKNLFCKGAAWLDYDNDNLLDLFLNNLLGAAQLFRNTGRGQFEDVTRQLEIDGPQSGFACWAWDYDNNGWLDVFATSYERNVSKTVAGMLQKPDGPASCRLWQNTNAHFTDRANEAGVGAVYETMGCNFGDLDNDGWLDFYLGTGDPEIATLIPNRMFRSDQGKRFVEITGSAGTGHLQKGHSVAFGDWDRNGDQDLFIQMGGAINGDKYHNILFQNPGHVAHQVTIRLVGRTENRAALGVRLKVHVDGPDPGQICRMISSGSSFGANTLEQSIGLGTANGIRSLEIHWPATDTTQVLEQIPVDCLITIVEGEDDFHVIPMTPIQRAAQ